MIQFLLLLSLSLSFQVWDLLVSAARIAQPILSLSGPTHAPERQAVRSDRHGRHAADTKHLAGG